MQNHYSGATRRVVRRFNESNKLKIDGLVDHEEQRGIFVKQNDPHENCISGHNLC